MPLLEAMAAGKPILCSNTTSLPEVAADAALYFDPRKPVEIASAIGRIADDPDLRIRLSSRGAERLAAFGNAEDMAAHYLRIFQEAVEQSLEVPQGVYGAHEDGWLGERFEIAFGHGAQKRRMQITLELPEWVPTVELFVRIKAPGAELLERVLVRGGTAVIECPLGSELGRIEVRCSPSFRPRQCGFGDDARNLTCQLKLVELVESEGARLELKSNGHEA
jgi:hypothetical protein